MNKHTLIRGSSLDPVKDFTKLFKTTARYRHRHEVFRDFVFCSACALHNSCAPQNKAWEQEYLDTINRYEHEDRLALRQLLHYVMEALEPEPKDILGPIFMSLELGDAWKGQFFTPPEVSRLMAEILFSDLDARLGRGDPVSVSEPACGAGGMVLAVVDAVLRRGYNPAQVMEAQAIDVDRTAALMTYIQLSLWNVPATIVVGNALTLEVREVWKTPALRNFLFRI